MIRLIAASLLCLAAASAHGADAVTLEQEIRRHVAEPCVEQTMQILEIHYLSLEETTDLLTRDFFTTLVGGTISGEEELGIREQMELEVLAQRFQLIIDSEQGRKSFYASLARQCVAGLVAEFDDL